jgi:hypothetical protein
MQLNISLFIKSCGTWTDPAAETKSIGLQAYASASRRNGTSIKPPRRWRSLLKSQPKPENIKKQRNANTRFS